MLDALLYFGRFMLGEVGMATKGQEVKIPHQDDLDSDGDENYTETIEL
jgi:hypothetical protein